MPDHRSEYQYVAHYALARIHYMEKRNANLRFMLTKDEAEELCCRDYSPVPTGTYGACSCLRCLRLLILMTLTLTLTVSLTVGFP